MIISKEYISPVGEELISKNPLAACSYGEVKTSIEQNYTYNRLFIINSSEKNCNGVVPVKEGIYQRLETYYNWFREKPLEYFKENAKKGGPIDVYKEFSNCEAHLQVGVEFETGNISSAHRAMNKLKIGIMKNNIDMGMLMLPIKRLAYYLTDRISNYEELEPYFPLLADVPFVVFGFDAERYDPSAPLLPKGQDGMSHRAIHKWKKV